MRIQNVVLFASALNAEEYFIKEIQAMLTLLSPEYSGGALVDYGCTARGTLDPQSKNIGDPVDELDREINHWKQCRRCARNSFEKAPQDSANYLFDTRTLLCSDTSGSYARSVCECDYELSSNIVGMKIQPTFQNFDQSNCSLRKQRHRPNHGCCQKPTGAFVWYNADLRCCDSSGKLKAIGYCSPY